MMKKNNKKGFTLAELLVVVGIIAILVAIAIPTFGAAQDKAYEGVAKANARSAYAEWAVSYIAGGVIPKENDTITYDTGDKATVCTVKSVTTTDGKFVMSITATVEGGKAGGYGPFDFSSISTKG